MPSRSKHPDMHRNSPKRLITAFKKAGSYSKLARSIGVNVKYVYDLLAAGTEPTNPEIRVKLFLPVRAFKDLPLGDRRFKHIRWWNRLTREQRNSFILFLHTYKDNENAGNNPV